ncbi:MAG: NUDIX domain-containing protein [Bacteroidota bacterium]|nr:NUDIX domain-containing protein [Bacteroidota bacterium]
MTNARFTIRVYAIIINERREVLLSDEYMLDTLMTKFPGGGLEYGEGPVDCLKREAMEEFGQSLEIISHFYTTDFFQPALFYDDTQLLSIYYRARFTSPIRFKISDKPYDFPPKVNGSQSFRWKSIESLVSEDLTFPIDRRVGEMLKNIK